MSMNIYDELEAALKVAHATEGLQGSPRSWRIGAGRVTIDELESWQLGPDLCGGRLRIPHPRNAQRRPRRAAGTAAASPPSR